MLKKRIIPCLDIKDGRTVKGIHFEQLRDAGDPIALAKRYVEEGADELVFLDITATIEKRKTLLSLIAEIASAINIPFTVGGGIHSLRDVKEIINAGADKISINSAAIIRPQLITETAEEFGSQCVVVAIDTRYENGNWEVFSNGGRTPTGRKAIDWADEAQQVGAGEILLTSMNNDGVQGGFAMDITAHVAEQLRIPVIASGGAGSMEHFAAIFGQSMATGALAASVFHFEEINIRKLKQYLQQNKIPVRL